MSIAKVTLQQVLSASKTKALLSNTLGDDTYNESDIKVVVVKGSPSQSPSLLDICPLTVLRRLAL